LPSSDAAARSPDGQVAAQLEAIVRSIDGIDKRLAHLDMGAVLQYQIAAAWLLEHILAEPRYDDPRRLERYGRSVYSQNEEDGILAEIFRRIGTTNRRFLEFGVGDGLQNNTLCLLEQGWTGAWLEGDRDHVIAIERGFRRKIDAGRLNVRNAMIDRDNIDDLIRALALPRDLDLLGIDIDGNDYFVWEAITVIEPRVVVIEYNAKFPPPMHWVIDYNPTHSWDGSDQFGASLESLTDLGRRKGYRLVGCNITGTNAFFVRSSLAGSHFADPADAVALYQPARYFLGSLFVSGHPAGYSRAQIP
jgi:hypothetical protein